MDKHQQTPAPSRWSFREVDLALGGGKSTQAKRLGFARNHPNPTAGACRGHPNWLWRKDPPIRLSEHRVITGISLLLPNLIVYNHSQFSPFNIQRPFIFSMFRHSQIRPASWRAATEQQRADAFFSKVLRKGPLCCSEPASFGKTPGLYLSKWPKCECHAENMETRNMTSGNNICACTWILKRDKWGDVSGIHLEKTMIFCAMFCDVFWENEN